MTAIEIARTIVGLFVIVFAFGHQAAVVRESRQDDMSTFEASMWTCCTMLLVIAGTMLIAR